MIQSASETVACAKLYTVEIVYHSVYHIYETPPCLLSVVVSQSETVFALVYKQSLITLETESLISFVNAWNLNHYQY